MNVCVYRHVRLDKNEVFYIGIGTLKRAHLKCRRNIIWMRIIEKTNYRIDILFENLSWEQAAEKEKEFISIYGRKDLNQGTLVNLTDGGEGSIGYKYSDETKDKMRKSHKDNPERSRNHIEYLSELNKGNKYSVKPIFQYDLEGNFIREWDSISDAVRELKIPHDRIIRCLKGKTKFPKYHIWKYKY